MKPTPTILPYRGLVMLLMMGEVLKLGQVAQQLPDSSWWRFLAYHQSHAAWVGCTLHDLIQPGEIRGYSSPKR